MRAIRRRSIGGNERQTNTDLECDCDVCDCGNSNTCEDNDCKCCRKACTGRVW